MKQTAQTSLTINPPGVERCRVETGFRHLAAVPEPRAVSVLSQGDTRVKERQMPNNSTGPGPAVLGRPQDDHRPAWRTVNITPTERLGRIGVGLVAVIAGIVLLTGAGPAVAVVLELLLVAAGLDLAVTGALGHCPLYAKLGHLPKSLRRTR